MIALCGYQGARVNAVLHLRWEDVDLDARTITWQAKWDKQGREETQPMRAPTSRVLGTIPRTSEWIFPASSRLSKRETYSIQSVWVALRRAEKRAGIEHHDNRALHGLRRMLFNDVLEVTGDVGAAMAAIRDQDLKVAMAVPPPPRGSVGGGICSTGRHRYGTRSNRPTIE